MTTPDADLRALAAFWRDKGTTEALACAAQLMDALAARGATERVELARVVREETLRLATMS